MLKSGKSQKKVAAKMGVSLRTIERLAAKEKDLPEFQVSFHSVLFFLDFDSFFSQTPKRKVGSGRTKSISLTTQLAMKRLVTRFPMTSARKMKQRIPALAHVSVRCIQDTLKNELNLPSRRPAKKPLLTQKMKDKCLEFARTHADWTVDDWKKVHVPHHQELWIRNGEFTVFVPFS